MSEIKPEGGERVAKFMAQAGIASRRDAERLIEAGKVKVNGKVIDSPVIFVTPNDVVEVDGELAEAATTSRVWVFHKPAGCLTTHRDPEGRATIFDHLPKHLPRVITIGRLDYNSEGLLLLTNDGALSRYLTLPETGWARHYRVRVFGKPGERELEKLRSGMTIEGVEYRPAQVEIENTTASHTWLSFTLREGKNREIRKICEAVGIVVTRLIRTSFGSFQLGSLEPGEVKEVSSRILKEQLADFYAGQSAYAPKPSDQESSRKRTPPREEKLKTKGRVVIRKERTISREEKEEKKRAMKKDQKFAKKKPPFKRRDTESGEGKNDFKPRRNSNDGKPSFKRRDNKELGEKKEFGSRPLRDGKRFESRGDRTGASDKPFKRRSEEGDNKKEFRPRPNREGFSAARSGKPPFKKREGRDGETREFKPRTDKGGKSPFKRRGEESSGGEREYHPRRKGFSPRGDRPAFKRRDEGDSEKREFRPRARPDGERGASQRGDRGSKPPFKRRGKSEGEKRDFKPRERQGREPAAPGEERTAARGKPFKIREGGDRKDDYRSRPSGDGKSMFKRSSEPGDKREFKPRERSGRERAGPGEERAAAMRGKPRFENSSESGEKKQFRPRPRTDRERPAREDEDGGRMTGRARPSRPRSWETEKPSPKRSGSGPRKPKGPRGAKDHRR